MTSRLVVVEINIKRMRTGNIMLYLSEWLYNMTVQKLVIVIKCADTNEVLERWQFNVECDKTVTEDRYVYKSRVD